MRFSVALAACLLAGPGAGLWAWNHRRAGWEGGEVAAFRPGNERIENRIRRHALGKPLRAGAPIALEAYSGRWLRCGKR